MISLVPGGGRPPPPAGLDRLERRIWRDVVDALPAHWLDPAGQLVLRRLVAQAAIAERREARLRQLRAEGQDGGEDADVLATMHGITAKIVALFVGSAARHAALAHGLACRRPRGRGRPQIPPVGHPCLGASRIRTRPR